MPAENDAVVGPYLFAKSKRRLSQGAFRSRGLDFEENLDVEVELDELRLMAIIHNSNKIKSGKRQWKIVAGGYVLLRVLKNDNKTYWVMTATADEWDGSQLAFPDQKQLMDVAGKTLSPIADKVVEKTDDSNRRYLEFHRIDDPTSLQAVANILAGKLGLDPATCEWLDALARQELKDIWSEHSVDVENDAYLSDGVYVTRGGKLRGLDS